MIHPGEHNTRRDGGGKPRQLISKNTCFRFAKLLYFYCSSFYRLKVLAKQIPNAFIVLSSQLIRPEPVGSSRPFLISQSRLIKKGGKHAKRLERQARVNRRDWTGLCRR